MLFDTLGAEFIVDFRLGVIPQKMTAYEFDQRGCKRKSLNMFFFIENYIRSRILCFVDSTHIVFHFYIFQKKFGPFKAIFLK